MRVSVPASHKRRRAFTLVEIMAVVLIIALLGTLVGVQVVGQIDKARVTTAKTQIKQLEAALEFYQMDNGRYPTSEQGLEALVNEPTIEPLATDYRPEGYLKGGSVPSDPWKEAYHYESPGTNNPQSFDLSGRVHGIEITLTANHEKRPSTRNGRSINGST